MNFNPTGKSVNLTIKFSIVILLSINSSLLFGQQIGKKVIHPLMGSVSISLESGGTIGYTDYEKPKFDFIWRTSAEYFFNTFNGILNQSDQRPFYPFESLCPCASDKT